MPVLNEANVRHLLRRTEFVDRPARVSELLGLGSIAAAVDNVMNVAASPASVRFTSTDNLARGHELTHFWLDRMAHDSARPLQEKMGFFWHGHFCSDLSKIGSAERARDQIDLFRRSGLGNFRTLAKTMSTQVAMLRYLDNHLNKASSPNENFARELMELFVLGVDNYSEADVQAATRAWTGHSTNRTDPTQYQWRPEWHDASPKAFLGQTINAGADQSQHGPETIDVMLGAGVVPSTARRNPGVPTRQVAADFLSKKLWEEFATEGDPPTAVGTAMRQSLLTTGFAIAPWLRTLLVHDDFYTTEVKNGLVRSPVEFVVAILVASGRRSVDSVTLGSMEAMGQRPLYPPNVDGWKVNSYWVDPSRMGSRAKAAIGMTYHTLDEYLSAAGDMRFGFGVLRRDDVIGHTNGVPHLTSAQVVDRMLALTQIRVAAATRSRIIDHINADSLGRRYLAAFLIFLAPELHLA
jgi:uncharacterized protein (DUF1800 family)